MTRHAATRVTVLLGASLLLAAPALAGDRAQFTPLGYSDDGRYFAFEEFGVQDGSGFAFSTTYIVDLPADKWAIGTPVRVRQDDESISIAELRQLAASEVAGRLTEYKISYPASIIAMNGDGEPDAAAYGLRYGRPGYGLSGVTDEHLLELELVDLPANADCAIIDDATKGMVLRLDGEEIMRDSGTLPKSRGCTLDYRVYAVVSPADFNSNPGMDVAIIAYYPFGFEGPDRRFMAVPLGN